MAESNVELGSVNVEEEVEVVENNNEEDQAQDENMKDLEAY
jgi:hypothetical protein